MPHKATDHHSDCIHPMDVAKGFTHHVMVSKAHYKYTKMIALSIAAGAFIAYGAQCCLTVMCGTADNLSWGLAKLVGAMVFATGLMMVVITGAELFTGNVMMMFSVIEKKISLMKLLRSWSVVYLGNFIGSLLVAGLVYFAACYDNANNALGILAIETAHQKVSFTFVEAFSRGILCNWLVCLAVWMATSSRSVIGKIFSIFFPIVTFVASGYEHSIANMFFIPNGILTKSIPAVAAATSLTSDQLAFLNWKTFLLNSLLPVTLGNIVGAVVFVVIIFWMAYLKEENEDKVEENKESKEEENK